MHCLNRYLNTVRKLRGIPVTSLSTSSRTNLIDRQQQYSLRTCRDTNILEANDRLSKCQSGIISIQVRNFMKVPQKKKKGKPKVTLSKEEMEQTTINVDDMHADMTSVIENLKLDYLRNLSVRTSSGAIENLVVIHEEEQYKLNEIVQIQRKGSNLVVINASTFPEVMPSVLIAIEESGMNLNPQREGQNILYLTIPMVTREHRENLAKNAKVLHLRTKEVLRDIQNRLNKQVQNQKGLVSDDLIFDTQSQIISITDEYISKAEKLMKTKQEELLGTKK